MLAASLFARAQFASVEANDVNITDDGYTTVRRLSDTEVITYIKSTYSHMFTYENNSTLSYNYIDLGLYPSFDKIKVWDFKIIDDILYFCGEDYGQGVGIIGTFDASLLRGPLGVNVHIEFFEVQNTTVLTRLEAYYDLSTSFPRVAAVGLNGLPGCGVWACGRMVDCADFWPGTGMATVSVNGTYFGGGNEIEQLFDVVSTNDWVVIVGYGNVGGQSGLMLRRFPKNNPMDPEVHNMYFYGDPYPMVAWEEVRAVALKENDIAVVYRGERVNNQIDFTDFRLFEINSMVNFNTQEYDVPNKSYIWEMAYMNIADRVVVLENFPAAYFSSNFVHLDPYQTSPYTSVFVYDDEWLFRSVTNLDGSYFVGAGCLHFLLRDVLASLPANNDYTTIPSLCPWDRKLDVEIIDNIEFDKIYEFLNQVTPPVIILPESPVVQQASLSVKCYSQN